MAAVGAACSSSPNFRSKFLALFLGCLVDYLAAGILCVSGVLKGGLGVLGYIPMPRQPTTGSELSLMLFHNMSPSETTGNPSVAYTQYFTEDAGLQPGLKVSAFPLSSHSDSSEGMVFEA